MHSTRPVQGSILFPSLDEELIREALDASSEPADPEELRLALRTLAEGLNAPPPGLARALAQPLPRPVRRDHDRASGIARRRTRSGRERSRRRAPGWGLAAAASLFGLVLAWSGHRAENRSRIPPGPLAPPASGLALRAAGEKQWRNFTATSAPAGGALLAMGPGILGALAEGGAIRQISHREARLDLGAAWFWVEPGTGGFSVSTPAGKARVTGTSFGARAGAGGVRIEVAEGGLILETSPGPVPVGAGAAWDSAAPKGAAVVARPEGTSLPQWVAALLEKDREAWAEAFVPSLAGSDE